MTEIPTDTPLTRLNYFNGKFMRAEHLRGEQFYLRSLVHLSSLSGGHGVVYGFDTTLTADRAHIVIGPGLAISGQGRVLYFPATTTISISDLIERSQNAPVSPSTSGEVFTTDIGDFEACTVDAVTSPDGQPSSGPLYVLNIGPVDAYCGNEDVFGRLCEDACVTSSERPFIIEGLLVKADPLELTLPNTTAIAFTDQHLRSRVASAYYAREFDQAGHLISKSGLGRDTWCLGSRLTGGACVPIAVFSVNAGTATFLDPWIARRERIETPARRYWAFKMRMRPWDVFLAQVLQFQCQLRHLLDPETTPLLPAPCENERGVLAETRTWLETLRAAYERMMEEGNGPINFPIGLTEIQEMGSRIEAVVGAEPTTATTRALIDGGIIELPAAGYLPIDRESPDSVNRQVRRLLGEGVNLRFCTVRHDYVAHALEEAQHMDRISLLEGLVDAANKPDVDILVPDGLIISQNGAVSGLGFRAAADFQTDDSRVRLRGIARGERLLNGGAAVYFGGNSSFLRDREDNSAPADPIGVPTDVATGPRPRPIRGEATYPRGEASTLPGEAWFQLTADRNPLELSTNGVCGLHGRLVLGEAGSQLDMLDAFAQATLTIDSRREDTPGVLNFTANLRVSGGQTSVETAGDETKEDSFAVRLYLDAEVDIPNDRATITFRSSRTKSSGRAELIFAISDAPLSVRATLNVYSTNSDGVEEVDSSGRALFREVDGVLSPGPLRRGVERALEALARKIDDLTAADAWKQDLFRTLEETPGELTMRAVRDWVLFHRRRRRVCEIDAPAEVVQPPRRYQVFHIRTVPGQIPAERILGLIADMRDGDTEAAEELFNTAGARPIFPVLFEGGDDQLLTSQATLLADYNNASPGNSLIGAVIGSPGEEDDEALESGRGNALEDVIEGVSPAHSEIRRDRLEDVPAAFSTSEDDGFILLVTEQQELAIDTHAAYVIPYNPNSFFDIEGLLTSDNFDSLFRMSTRIIHTQFVRGTQSLLAGGESPPFDQAWTEADAAQRTRTHIRSYAKRLPPGVSDVDSYVLGQARMIDQNLRGPQVSSTVPAIAKLWDESLPVDTDNLTFFLAGETNIIFAEQPPAVRFVMRLDNALVGLNPVVRFDNPETPVPSSIDELVRSIGAQGRRTLADWTYGSRREDSRHAERMKVLRVALENRGVRLVGGDPKFDSTMWTRAELQPFEPGDVTDVVVLVLAQ